jgi:hypothetical protein
LVLSIVAECGGGLRGGPSHLRINEECRGSGNTTIRHRSGGRDHKAVMTRNSIREGVAQRGSGDMKQRKQGAEVRMGLRMG